MANVGFAIFYSVLMVAKLPQRYLNYYYTKKTLNITTKFVFGIDFVGFHKLNKINVLY